MSNTVGRGLLDSLLLTGCVRTSVLKDEEFYLFLLSSSLSFPWVQNLKDLLYILPSTLLFYSKVYSICINTVCIYLEQFSPHPLFLEVLYWLFRCLEFFNFILKGSWLWISRLFFSCVKCLFLALIGMTSRFLKNFLMKLSFPLNPIALFHWRLVLDFAVVSTSVRFLINEKREVPVPMDSLFVTEV